MATKSKRPNPRRWLQFRSAFSFCERCTLLDAGRAKVMLNTLVLPDILQRDTAAFVKALHDASKGNPAVFETLLAAVRKWRYFSSPADIAKLKACWAKATLRPPRPNAFALLRRVCVRQRLMPPSMIEVLFDDASFDFTAYLNWHKSSAGDTLPNGDSIQRRR
ncbi:hypothetical protein ACVMII_005410 [Bradyrhizobium diazoefficiens]